MYEKHNANFGHTMVKLYGDHLSCMVTSVKNVKELLAEYWFAFDKINETMQGMEANAPRVANQFPEKRNRWSLRCLTLNDFPPDAKWLRIVIVHLHTKLNV